MGDDYYDSYGSYANYDSYLDDTHYQTDLHNQRIDDDFFAQQQEQQQNQNFSYSSSSSPSPASVFSSSRPAAHNTCVSGQSPPSRANTSYNFSSYQVNCQCPSCRAANVVKGTMEQLSADDTHVTCSRCGHRYLLNSEEKTSAGSNDVAGSLAGLAIVGAAAAAAHYMEKRAKKEKTKRAEKEKEERKNSSQGSGVSTAPGAPGTTSTSTFRSPPCTPSAPPAEPNMAPRTFKSSPSAPNKTSLETSMKGFAKVSKKVGSIAGKHARQAYGEMRSELDGMKKSWGGCNA